MCLIHGEQYQKSYIFLKNKDSLLIKHQHTDGKVEITIINSDAAAGALNNKALEDFACEVTKELRKVFRKIQIFSAMKRLIISISAKSLYLRNNTFALIFQLNIISQTGLPDSSLYL